MPKLQEITLNYKMVYKWMPLGLDAGQIHHIHRICTEQIHHIHRINPPGFMTHLSFKGPETCWILNYFELEIVLLELYTDTQMGDDYIKDLSPLRKSVI